MKNIIIVTFNKARNFGAMLQEFALQEIIAKKNYSVKVLNYVDKNIKSAYKIIKIEKTNLKKFIKSFASSVIFLLANIKRYKSFNNFEKNNIKLTQEYSENEIKKIEGLADVYITGSDQVWNCNITNGLSDVYCLNFDSKNKKKISYAASIGNSKIENNFKEIYKEKISKLDEISVREETAQKELENLIINRKITVVLDPTLLLTKEEWNQKTKNMKQEKEKYILAYDLVEENEDYRRIVETLSEKTGLKVIHFEKRNRFKCKILRSAYSDGPLEFVNLIKNAEYTVVTSFHGTVFSILLNKKTWIIPPKKTGSRVIDLLNKVGLNNRIIYSLDEFNHKNYDENIDYSSVNNILDVERKKSIEWLYNAIEKGV